MVIKLVQTDSTNPFKITLSVGEHDFGRGKLLGCEDKRISRNHGQLEVFEDHIVMRALHQNPCFYIKHGTDEKQILKKDSMISLKNGDRFGLLPDAFWYEVILCTALDNPPEESPTEDTNTETYECTNSDETVNDNPRADSPCILTNNNPPSIANSTTQRQEDNEDCESDNGAQKSNQNKPTEERIENKDAVTVKRSHSIEQNGDIKKFKNADVTPECTGNISESAEAATQSVEVKTESTTVNTESAEAATESVEVKTEPTTVKTESQDDQPGPSIDQPQGAQNNNLPDPTIQIQINPNPIQPNRPLRERCMYGAACYRRNPAHFSQFCHPSDADWGDGNQAPCPFGATCTRRDPRHHRDHHHPAGYRPPPPPGMQIVERHGHIFYINAAAVVNFYDDRFEVVDSEGDSVDHDYEF